MSSWQVQQLKFAFGIGGFMSFYGIVGLLTWFGGEKMGLPVNTRIMVIVVLLLTLPFVFIIGYVATRRSKKKEEQAQKEAEAKAEEKAGGGEKPQKLATPSGNYQDLPSGAEEVVKFLQTSNLGGANGKDAIYALPWYIVAGTPKSGKSSLVLGSNLNFQTLPSQRQSEQKMIRPTRNIDWRVTSDAVFVDTAGRYQSEGADEDEWNSLLETIKKYRSNRPIDGMLLVADTEKILSSDERQIEELAKVMRTRLDEAMQRLKVRFPVYLVFTHADAIEGFRDSFSTSKKEGETLVWGATIPLEKSDTAHSLFDEEYGLLHNSVMKRRLMRLSAPFPPVRQLRIFNFPLHFGSARRKLGAFVSALFRPNPFSENPFLRGYYFTSIPASRPQVQPDKTMSGAAPQTVGTTYFTEKFFRDVVLRDKDLVRTFQQQRQKPPILGWLVTLLGAAVVLILLTLAAVSLVNNQKLLNASAEKGSAVLNIAKADGNVNPLSKTPDAATREVNAIEDLRVLMVELDNYDRNGAPIYLGMGLYSGNTIYKGDNKSKGLLNIYYNAVGRRYMDPTVKRLEDELRKFAAAPPVVNVNELKQQEEDNLSLNYDRLKVYLMLSDKYRDKSNDTDITNVLKEFWFAESKLPESLKDDAENQLKFYAKQADRFEGPDKFPRIQNDANLITEVRKKLQAFPPYKRYYKRKVTEITKDVEAKYGEMTVDAILQRNGGDGGFMEGSVTVPGAYTVEGFKQMDKAILLSAKELSETDWVMSDDKSVTENIADISKESNKIREQYFRDYADRWREFVKNVKVKPYRKDNDKDISKVSAKDALASFSSANSPMKVLLREIDKNTNLSAKPKPTGWWETVKGWFKSETLPDTGGASQVEKEFRPLFSFVEDKGDKSAKIPIDEYQTAITDVSIKFNGFSDTEINELASLQDDEKNKKFPQLKGAMGKIDGQTKPFKDAKDAAVGAFFADLLRQPIGNLSALLGADTIKTLGEKWASEVLTVAQTAEQGYPFVEGDNNADFANLKAYLAPGSGKLSQFYDQNLKKYFDGNPGQLKLKDPNTAPFTQEFVDYLNKAFTLRQALFGKGEDVKFDYNFELTNPKDALVEMTIDGITLSSADKPSSPISFPASTGGGNGVLIKLLSTGATTSTSGTTTTANTSSSSVNSNGSTSSTVTTPTPKPVQNSNSSSSTDEKQFLGPWGLFKFFDAAGAQKQSDNSYLLSYKLKSGKTLTAKITPSGVDPFNKEIYKLRAPKTILK
ncbi:MAG TPA: type VI secretion system membrane subunit TssM [Pyrinomonadaceae bacterium]|nr:type VI secretion system membrane subunit TssM [Pyrinomonadaceae bacterium]